MGTILSVYSTKAFREFLLPAVNNMENAIILEKDIFSLDTDIQLRMEVIENRWYFLPPDNDYTVEYTANHEKYMGIPLKNGDLLTVILPNQEHISLMVDEIESSFHVFEKYDIGGVEEITVGNGEGNDIIYNTRNLISGNHAVFRQSALQCIVEDRSRNGIFVNARRVVGSRQLEFGDCVNIYGLCIVYLGNILAVNSQNESFHVNRVKIKEHYEKREDNVPSVPSKGKILYHRSPRQIYRLDEDTVEIEAPPQPKISNQKPMGMLLGPTMTMALPMLLGCSLAIYSTRASGSYGGALSEIKTYPR